jgi:type IV pilus assembly protein PilA
MRAMFCSRCGAQLVAGAAFCSKCGSAVVAPPIPSQAPPVPPPVPLPTPTPTPTSGLPPTFTPQRSAPAEPLVIKRPLIVTILAVLQFVGAGFWLLAGFGGMAANLSGPGTDAFGGIMVMGIFGCLGLAQLICGIGLIGLKPYGRTLQLIFAWIGLIAIPVGTVISVLILIYLFKPGIKLIFSGRPGDDFTEQEIAEIRNDTATSSGMVVVIVIVGVILLIGVIAVVAAISVPALLRARTAGNEASAISSLRAIVSAQATFAASCAQGGYAVSLDDLARPPASGGAPFINADLGEDGIQKMGYTFSVSRDRSPASVDVGSAAATCNGATGQPASSFFAVAEPATPGTSGVRYFAVDARGAIYESFSPISNPIMDSSAVTPIR